MCLGQHWVGEVPRSFLKDGGKEAAVGVVSPVLEVRETVFSGG